MCPSANEPVKRVCLLTGASGLFGQAFLQAHAKDYHFVALYHRTLPLIESQAVRLIDPLAPAQHAARVPPTTFTVRCDLRLAGECDRLLDLAFARFGRVDVVIHAAAMSVWGPLIGSGKSLEGAAEQFHLNAIVPLELSTILLRRFWRDDPAVNQANNRNIICLSSLAASQLFPHRGQSVYAASKAALTTLTRHMASEFAAVNVRANALEPNSFPSLVPTKSVVEGARHLDQSTRTGEVVTVLT